MKPFFRIALLSALAVSTVSAAADVPSVIIGTVIDARSRQPVAGVQVTLLPAAPKAAETTVTDEHGNYRLSGLAQGIYGLRFEKEGFKAFARSEVHLRPNRTVRVNQELMPAALEEGVETAISPPTCDPVNDCCGMTAVPVDQEFIKRIAVARPQRSRPTPAPRTREASDRERAPSWMLSRMVVLVPDGTPQLVYRAPLAKRESMDFGN